MMSENLVVELVQIAAGSKGDNVEMMRLGFDNRESLAANRTRGTEDGKMLHRRRQSEVGSER
jgi:hypothetical protein